MVFDPSQLKKIRRQLGLTQHQFAARAGISQSMVAKIESGKLEPAYSKVKKIEEALASLLHEQEQVAEDIVVKKIISVRAHEKVSHIIQLMQQHAISQVPVVQGKSVIGMVSESSILSKHLDDMQHASAKEVMDEVPPIIAKDAPFEVLKQLLSYYLIVLVKEKGNVVGLITKADLVKSLV